MMCDVEILKDMEKELMCEGIMMLCWDVVIE
jgi:hypothetical protein